MTAITSTAQHILNRLKEENYSVAELARETRIPPKQVFIDLHCLFDNGLVYKRNYLMNDGAKMVIYGAVPEKDLASFSKTLLRS